MHNPKPFLVTFTSPRTGGRFDPVRDGVRFDFGQPVHRLTGQPVQHRVDPSHDAIKAGEPLAGYPASQQSWGGSGYPASQHQVQEVSYEESYRFATFEEVQKAAQAWEPQSVAQSDGAIVAAGGKQIGKYVKDQH